MLSERRFGLAPLTVRDRTARTTSAPELATRPDLRAPTYAVPGGPFGGAWGACRPPAPSPEAEWGPLRDLARTAGWPVVTQGSSAGRPSARLSQARGGAPIMLFIYLTR